MYVLMYVCSVFRYFFIDLCMYVVNLFIHTYLLVVYVFIYLVFVYLFMYVSRPCFIYLVVDALIYLCTYFVIYY